VLVLDVSMPGLDGLEVARQVTQRYSGVKVVIVSMHAGEDYVLRAMRSGALGYVLKDASAESLVEAVHAVASGKRYLCSPLSERAIEAYIRQGDSGPTDIYDTLTTREREIFQLIAEGNTNNEIADRLSISVRTVETHRANLMRKLNLRTHAHLVAYAVRRGLITGVAAPAAAAA
jgi:DNA-binding NarL/FixJ family response regulator